MFAFLHTIPLLIRNLPTPILCRVDSATLTLWTGSFSNIRGVWLVFFLFLLLFSYFVEIFELNANIVDPDQTPRSAASDQGLHCLPMSHLWDARHMWVKRKVFDPKKSTFCLFRVDPFGEGRQKNIKRVVSP